MFLAFIIGLFVLGTFIGVASLFGEMKNSTWNIQTPVQTKDSSNRHDVPRPHPLKKYS
jgi:hypothetical protein